MNTIRNFSMWSDIPSEQTGKWREEYYKSLIKRIKNGKTKTEYLFSLPYLKSELNKLKRVDAEKILNWWEILLTYKTLDLRFTEEAFNPCIISDKQILIKAGAERQLIHSDIHEGIQEIKKFNSVFKRSKKSTKEEILKIRKSF